MTTKTSLGRLESVDLRSCWDREDSDFTPWLAAEENIALLGQVIGMELEVQQEEASVGPFRADILCRDTATDELVIVENQLERTDHGHLGQTLTYAAGLDAVTVIWIAARFREEHRAALDWLNRISHEDFRFFGIEVEAWRIGDSPPAPKFNLVAKPNDWSKTVKEAAGRRTALSPTEEAQVTFWRELGDKIEESPVRLRRPKASPGNWCQWGLGRTGIWLLGIVRMNEVAVGVDIERRVRPTWFAQLHSMAPEIEAELGFHLTWEEREEYAYSQLRLSIPADFRDPEGRQEAITWMIKCLAALDSALRPRVRQLTGGDPGEDEDQS